MYQKRFFAEYCIVGIPHNTAIYFYIKSNQIYSPVAAKNPYFCRFLPFFGIRHLVVSPIGSSLRKLKTVPQLRTFLYPTASKSFLYSNVFMAKSVAQALTFKSVTDRQTNSQKNSTFFATPAAGEIRAQPNLAW